MGTLVETTWAYAKSASEAIEILTENAIHEHGHDSYSGTIATCDGWEQEGKIDQKAFTKAAINRWINKTVDNIEKREIVYLELPRSFAKGHRRGIKKYIVVYAVSW